MKKILHSKFIYLAMIFLLLIGLIAPVHAKTDTGASKIPAVEKKVEMPVVKEEEEPRQKAGWQEMDGKWYYFSDSGAMQTGWIKPASCWYYLNSSGVMVTGWQEIDGKWYYFSDSGAMQTGWIKPASCWYYLKESGAMATGWLKIDGKWYFFSDSGAMQTGWIKPASCWYYLKESGAMVTGWQEINGKWYFFSDSGAMQTGWIKPTSCWYYLNSSGAMVKGWQKINEKWYYFNDSGAMQTGWLKDNGKWYYLDGSGAMVTGAKWIEGEYCIFDASGAMFREDVNRIRSYSDNTCSIDVFKLWYGHSWCYCAHIQTTDYGRFGTADAYNSYGSRETVAHAGSRLGAIICVNGDYASNTAELHAAVRKGKVTAKGDKKVYACEAYNSNTGMLFNAYEGYCYPGTSTKCSTYTYNQAVNKKLLTDTFIFGPAGLNNGTIKGTNGGSSRPRTLIGTNGNPGDIWLVVAAGDGYQSSSGLTHYEGCKLLQELGCTFGGNIDGGGSSTMYFRGELLVYSGREDQGEGIGDFVYVK